jgi:hypothetical protein
MARTDRYDPQNSRRDDQLGRATAGANPRAAGPVGHDADFLRLVEEFMVWARANDRRSVLHWLSYTASAAAAVPIIQTARSGGVAASVLAREVRVRRTVDEWCDVVWEYGLTYLTTPREILLPELAVDLTAILHQIDLTADDRAVARLSGLAARLAALTAMCCTHLRHPREAREFWGVGRRLANASMDVTVNAWVRGHEITNSIYLARPVPVILRLIEQANGLVDRVTTSPGAAEIVAAKAQVLAVLGRVAEARAAAALSAALFERLPDSVTRDHDSIFGWPEDRLRHAEAFIEGRLGEANAPAFDRALALYPMNRTISRAQIELHRAVALVRCGDVHMGLRHASTIVAGLPEQQIGQLVLTVAGHVLTAVPTDQCGKRQVLDYRRQLQDAGATP